MIPNETYSICGCFEYSNYCSNGIKLFIDKTTNKYSNNLVTTCFKTAPTDFIYTKWTTGFYNSEKVNLINATANNYIITDLDFKIGDVNASFYLTILDEKYYELSLNLSNEDLVNYDSNMDFLNYLRRTFFKIFSPLYGCSGTEVFVEPIGNISDSLLTMLFYEYGFVNKRFYSEFKKKVSKAFLKRYNIIMDDNMHVFSPK